MNKGKIIKRMLGFFGVLFCIPLVLCACVDQDAGKKRKDGDSDRVIVTSLATAEICDRLNMELVGVCDTHGHLPKRYEELPKVGMAMNPDLEIIRSLHPGCVLSPITLKNDLEPKFKAIDVEVMYLDLTSTEGMYRSIMKMGKKFGHEKEAKQLHQEFEKFMKEYRDKNKGKKRPKVLVLMGVPGSYLVATEHSYVGSLIKLAGGDNVFKSNEGKEFLTANTEEMKKTEPDVIVRASHGVSEQVQAEFAKEFKTNQIWKHFKAVQENRVYDLTPQYFNMSANFNYPQALEELQPILYGQ